MNISFKPEADEGDLQTVIGLAIKEFEQATGKKVHRVESELADITTVNDKGRRYIKHVRVTLAIPETEVWA